MLQVLMDCRNLVGNLPVGSSPIR